MSRRLIPVKREQLIHRLRELGFEGPFFGRKHQVMRRGNQTIRVPNPHHDEISVDLLSHILRDSGISREEWLGEN
ncbi:type II toxin-antitoxin system HicA family toxin [Candidatus Acetothermia bacterium]|nr:type II toxin-antitoxin system HicA family toxin [Candidatus Acetothermia bacterium]